MQTHADGDLFAEVRRQNMEFHPVLRLDDPYATAANPQPFIDSFVAREVEGWTGFTIGKATTPRARWTSSCDS